jgi:hypothetical protein
MSADASDGCDQGGGQVPDVESPVPSARITKAEAARRFGEAISSLWLRASPDLTQQEIAETCEPPVGATTIRDVMHGRRFPKRDIAQRIATAMGADFNDISGLWDDLNALLHALPVASPRIITRYWDNSEFYAAARERILPTTRQIRVTYARQYPPSDVSTPEAVEYFATMLDWAGGPGPRSVQRIFGIPVTSPAARRRIVSYLREHAAEIEHRGLKKYQPYVFEYTAKADLLNMALFDREVAFMAVSRDHPEYLSGVQIIGNDCTSLFVDYFEQLLPGCQPLAEYLEDLDRTRTAG